MTKASKEERCKSALFEIVSEGIESATRREKLSLEDFESIGIAGELKKLVQLNAKFSAEEILGELRKFDLIDDFDHSVKIMKSLLSTANLTLEDIGTNKKEIQKIKKEYLKYLEQ